MSVSVTREPGRQRSRGLLDELKIGASRACLGSVSAHGCRVRVHVVWREPVAVRSMAQWARVLRAWVGRWARTATEEKRVPASVYSVNFSCVLSYIYHLSVLAVTDTALGSLAGTGRLMW